MFREEIISKKIVMRWRETAEKTENKIALQAVIHNPV